MSCLKKVLHKLIHEDQKCFIAGRFIRENISLIYDVLFETKQQQIAGLILSIDFKQAFESVSWKFIHKTLDYFNFRHSFPTQKNRLDEMVLFEHPKHVLNYTAKKILIIIHWTFCLSKPLKFVAQFLFVLGVISSLAIILMMK